LSRSGTAAQQGAALIPGTGIAMFKKQRIHSMRVDPDPY
jgi:hypothetical protein